MTTQTSLSSASRPGIFIEAVTLAGRADRRHQRIQDGAAQTSRPRFRSVIAGLSVAIGVVSATVLMVMAA